MLEEIKSALNTLSQLQAEGAQLLADKQAAKDRILTDDIKSRLSEIDSSYRDAEADIAKGIAVLETRIKADVLIYGSSVKAAVLHAVYTQGRVTWDTKRLDGYAAAHPELLAFRKQGEPTVSIRPAK